MSASHVRNTFRNVVTGAAIPVYDTINLHAEPTDPIWLTYEFESEYMQKDSYCDDWEEIGVILVYVVGKAGRGDAAVIAAAETELKRIYNSTDPAGLMEFTGILPIEETSGGDADPNYRVSFGIEYVYFTRY